MYLRAFFFSFSILYLFSYLCIYIYIQVLASKTKIYMVLEYVTGGELFDRIVCSSSSSYSNNCKLPSVIHWCNAC